ncbi:MAG: hypothetical protein BZY79_00295 [SAR202 cluster bacterium Casp-Chloro-G4]|nr:DUF302 domain-containing protein [Chloroflexota bacterium]MDA1228397.1 DUF302 domain-containing protein [Chloroflexota bacterium]PKB62111.1 MAG: hypothetical protein BZY79_00295 [SAR202 cluster bacterium Casp-Chloro-G4]
MSYFFTKTLSTTFEEAIEKTRDELKKEGFGVLTEIDVTDTLKEKLGVDFQNYRILGACNPPFAYKALLTENKIGTMLPCNVIVQEQADGSIEVSAVDPAESMKAIDNPELAAIAEEVRQKLQTVVNSL